MPSLGWPFKPKDGSGGATAPPPVDSARLSGELQVPNPDSKQFGLLNIGGNTWYAGLRDVLKYGNLTSTFNSYANSVLQALYFCQPFRDLVCSTPDTFREEFPPIQLPPPTITGVSNSKAVAPPPPVVEAQGATSVSTTPPPPTLFSALRSLYLHIATHSSAKGTVAPTSFITKLKKENELFRGPMHQDAHEFLNYLLNKILEDLQSETHSRTPPAITNTTEQDDQLSNSIKSMNSSTDTTTRGGTSATTWPPYTGLSTNPTLVQTLFEGVLTNETRCLTCETVSSRDESFLDLSIDIEQNSSVTACLRQFSASEMLCQKNKFFCDSCCSLQEAEKRMKIKILPNVLALHLKRFKLLPAENKYVKLAYRVAFPLELRLFNTVDDAEDPDRLYRLFAIVVHLGGGPHQGHYITIVKSFGSIWRVFDDTTVYTIQETDIPKYFGEGSSGAGYVLFYQAADLVPEPSIVAAARSALGDKTNLPVSSANINAKNAVPLDITAIPLLSTSPVSIASHRPLPSRPPLEIPIPTPSTPLLNLPIPSIPDVSPASPTRNHVRSKTAPGTPVDLTSSPFAQPSSPFTGGTLHMRPPKIPRVERPPSSHAGFDASPLVPPSSSNNENTKEPSTRRSWFGTPKRKESLPKTIGSPAAPTPGTFPQTAPLPEVKQRSALRGQMNDKDKRHGMHITGPIAIPPSPSSQTVAEPPPDTGTNRFGPRPRTAPSSATLVDSTSNGTLSHRHSLDQTLADDSNSAPPPPVPILPTSITGEHVPANHNLHLSSRNGHSRRSSISRTSIVALIRPRAGSAIDNHAASAANEGVNGSQPPSPVITSPAPRVARRVQSVMPLSTTPDSYAQNNHAYSRPASTVTDDVLSLPNSSRPESYLIPNPSIQPTPPPRFAATPSPDKEAKGLKRASRKLSLTGGGFFGGWGSGHKDREREKARERDNRTPDAPPPPRPKRRPVEEQSRYSFNPSF